MNDYTHVTASGEPANLAELAKKHQPPPKVSLGPKRTEDRTKASVSDGFAVMGYSPEHLTAAEKEHAAAIEAMEAWNKDHPKEQKRVPAPWDESVYMRQHKAKRAAKPYPMESSADTAAALVRKAGWKNVTVVEILKG